MTGTAYDKPLYIFHEKGLAPKGASAAQARWSKEFERDNLVGQTSAISSKCSQIRADLVQKKNQEAWALAGKLAVGIGAVGAGYLLYRAWKKSK